MRSAVLVVAVSLLAGSRGQAGELTVTFIGNEAFHVTDGNVALLIDFPYDPGASGRVEWSPEQVPTGPKPLCLFTHDHADHFAFDLVPKYCEVVVGPSDLEHQAGVAMLPLADPLRWKGLTIRPIATRHSGNDPIEHESYLVEWQGQRLYFTGDAGDTSALLDARDLDAAFVYTYLLGALAKSGARVDARRIVACHHEPGEKVADVQGRIVPAPGQVLKLASSRNAAVTDAPDSTPVPAAPRTAEDEELIARFGQGRHSTRTGAGKAYFEGSFSQRFYELFSKRLTECSQQTGEVPVGTPGFDIAIELAADGHVLSALVSPRSKLTGCFADKIAQETFGAPPAAGFWVPIRMRLTTK
jgi:L-ascorbate metabolism protein UlaG (beta-lactamase superfamily)